MNRVSRAIRGPGLAAVLAMLAMLGGCAGLPTYQPTPNQPLATIKLSPSMAGQSQPLSICDGRECYELKNDHGELRVPVGKRLLLFKVLVATGYQRMYSCTPDLTFVPYAGVVYYADFSLRAEHCLLSLYRDAPFSRVGVMFEPTVRGVPHKHAG
ncbi:MAG TPA: hypothetical protein VN624_19330 [Rhodanobacter sp.]|nr:hypothetical protein [Rhodanobacter sp.]